MTKTEAKRIRDFYLSPRDYTLEELAALGAVSQGDVARQLDVAPDERHCLRVRSVIPFRDAEYWFRSYVAEHDAIGIAEALGDDAGNVLTEGWQTEERTVTIRLSRWQFAALDRRRHARETFGGFLTRVLDDQLFGSEGFDSAKPSEIPPFMREDAAMAQPAVK